MKTIAGIDYSTSTPCICIHKGETFSLDNCKFYFMTPRKTLEGWVVNKKIHGTPHIGKFKDRIKKYDLISDWALNILIREEVDIIGIEGYSMGSRTGMILDIAENGGILRYKLYKNGQKYEQVAPTTIKKFATGKGNSKKEKMEESFLEETKTDYKEILTPKAKNCISPVSDIIDSYYIAKYFFEKSS